jgi:hypothetical protein
VCWAVFWELFGLLVFGPFLHAACLSGSYFALLSAPWRVLALVLIHGPNNQRGAGEVLSLWGNPKVLMIEGVRGPGAGRALFRWSVGTMGVLFLFSFLFL